MYGVVYDRTLGFAVQYGIFSGRTHARTAVRRTFSIKTIFTESSIALHCIISTLLLGKWLAKHGFFCMLFKLENVM